MEQPGEMPAEHAAWATRYARTCCKRLGICAFDADDLIQEAHLAALEAWHRYDPARGRTFRQYAWRRVNGAVTDAIYRQVGKPGSAKRRFRARMVSIEDVGELAGR